MRSFALILGLALAACAPPRPAQSPPAPPTWQGQAGPGKADFLRIRKGARTLEAWSGPRLLLVVRDVQLGPAPVGPKRFEGDGRTPEGRYRIDWRNPHSAYHLSLHVSYPNPRDVAFAEARGRSAGGMIMIHGQPNGSAVRVGGDWTDGCAALSNDQIETLWNIVEDEAEVEIVP